MPLLEQVRKRLRALVKLIERAQRKPIYTDFADELGDERDVTLPGFIAPDQFERFKAKARAFLREHRDHATIRKLRLNAPLVQSDLEELERMLVEQGIGSADDIRRAADETQGLGLFVRSLIGLDREAAKNAFAGFLAGKNSRPTRSSS